MKPMTHVDRHELRRRVAALRGVVLALEAIPEAHERDHELVRRVDRRLTAIYCQALEVLAWAQDVAREGGWTPRQGGGSVEATGPTHQGEYGKGRPRGAFLGGWGATAGADHSLPRQGSGAATRLQPQRALSAPGAGFSSS